MKAKWKVRPNGKPFAPAVGHVQDGLESPIAQDVLAIARWVNRNPSSGLSFTPFEQMGVLKASRTWEFVLAVESFLADGAIDDPEAAQAVFAYGTALQSAWREVANGLLWACLLASAQGSPGIREGMDALAWAKRIPTLEELPGVVEFPQLRTLTLDSSLGSAVIGLREQSYSIGQWHAANRSRFVFESTERWAHRLSRFLRGQERDFTGDIRPADLLARVWQEGPSQYLNPRIDSVNLSSWSRFFYSAEVNQPGMWMVVASCASMGFQAEARALNNQKLNWAHGLHLDREFLETTPLPGGSDEAQYRLLLVSRTEISTPSGLWIPERSIACLRTTWDRFRSRTTCPWRPFDWLVVETAASGEQLGVEVSRILEPTASLVMHDGLSDIGHPRVAFLGWHPLPTRIVPACPYIESPKDLKDLVERLRVLTPSEGPDSSSR